MNTIYKIISLLLDYPTEEVKGSLNYMLEVATEEAGTDGVNIALLKEFMDYASPLSLNEWQMQYVQQFDYSPKTNLYLFDHVYGDSRERGQAMVDLTEMYNKSGFIPSPDELPDFLPLYLEFMSTQEEEQADVLLKEVAHILANMYKQLEKHESPYKALLLILCNLAQVAIPTQEEKKGVNV